MSTSEQDFHSVWDEIEAAAIAAEQLIEDRISGLVDQMIGGMPAGTEEVPAERAWDEIELLEAIWERS